MKILVIGGAGYIGSVACENFINKGHDVVVLDNFATGFKKLVHPKAKFIEGCMLNTDLVEDILRTNKIDVVALYAAKTIVSQSVAKPMQYFKVNVGGMVSVLNAMKNAKVNKIIFASSAAVYGQCEHVPVKEEDSKSPINPYGQTKLVGEWLLEDARKSYGINYVSFRFFNVAGASDSGKYGAMVKIPTLLISSINDAILNKRDIKIFGNKYKTKDGTCLRDYVHVQDLADAAEKSLSLLAKNQSDVFNLGSNHGFTVLEVVETALNILKPSISYKYEPGRSGDSDQLATDNTKALKALKWKPDHSLKDMIVSDYEFRKHNV